jgi:hypothetical protein
MAGHPKLIFLSEQFRGKTCELTENVYNCGRVEENQIFLKDSTVSSKHCQFIKNGATFIIKDLDSTNGTRVNNIPVTGEQTLQNGDILQIGGIEALYDCEDKSVTTAIKTQTGILLNGEQVGISTVKQMVNFDPFAGKKHGRAHKITKMLLIALVVLIVLLIAFLVYQMFFRQKNTETPSSHNGNGAIYRVFSVTLKIKG